MGILNQTDLIGEEGKSLAEHLNERGEEIAMRELKRREMESKYQIEIDPRYFMMLTPNEQPPKEEVETIETVEPDDDDSPEN
jgi:hypothetical protein